MGLIMGRGGGHTDNQYSIMAKDTYEFIILLRSLWEDEVLVGGIVSH